MNLLNGYVEKANQFCLEPAKNTYFMVGKSYDFNMPHDGFEWLIDNINKNSTILLPLKEGELIEGVNIYLVDASDDTEEVDVSKISREWNIEMSVDMKEGSPEINKESLVLSSVTEKMKNDTLKYIPKAKNVFCEPILIDDSLAFITTYSEVEKDKVIEVEALRFLSNNKKMVVVLSYPIENSSNFKGYLKKLSENMGLNLGEEGIILPLLECTRPPIPVGIDIPQKFLYIQSKAFRLLNLGVERYREQDYFNQPNEALDEIIIEELKSACRQIYEWKGVDYTHPLEISLACFNALKDLFHFEYSKHDTYEYDNEQSLLEIHMKHIMDSTKLTLFVVTQ